MPPLFLGCYWSDPFFFKWGLTLAHWTQVSDRCPLGYLFFLHATFTVFWLNIALLAVHSGECCGPWASGYDFWIATPLRHLLHGFPCLADVGDKMIEVVGLENSMHAAQVYAGLRASGKRLAQCSTVVIRWVGEAKYRAQPLKCYFCGSIGMGCVVSEPCCNGTIFNKKLHESEDLTLGYPKRCFNDGGYKGSV